MSVITWDSSAGFPKGTVNGQWRYAIAGGCVWFREDGDRWCLIGLESNDPALAEAHWAGLQDRVRQLAAAELGLTTTRYLTGAPRVLEPDEAAKLYAAIDALPPAPVAPPLDRRTLWVNGVIMTGEVRSISTHTHGDGTQSIDISFVPDSADDTVRAIESMRVDQ
ncbi:hypothetical protein [Mycobacteroides chelonae]|uniref:hypothetical protein n=1 Tax=Mycobacteroides chelonae TaxID=1774 RepID=UPI000991B108|nr:hypothetical protein [Mycobacteroides chelonae]